MTRTCEPMPTLTAVPLLVNTRRTRPFGPRPTRYLMSLLTPRLTRLMALAVVIVGTLAAPGLAVAQEEGLPLGATPDAVVLETLDGTPVDLSELTGEKPVLLEFWATWCAVCRALEPAMNAVHDSFADRVEIVVVAAAVGQTRERVEQHLARHPAPGRVVWDTRGRFTRAYEAPGTGYVVILDTDGNVAYTGTGVDQDLVTAVANVLERSAR